MLRSHRKIELSPKLKFGVGRTTRRGLALKYGAIFSLLITAGLTINAIRLIFTSAGAHNPTAVPQVLGVSDTKIQTDSSIPEISFIEYKVQKGDTLFNVSQQFKIPWATLATLNNLQSPFTLKPGQTLKVPKQ